jgi:hypothetical protein
MPASDAPDHDQRLKVLLKEFFEQFFLSFFPPWAQRFDFGGLAWMDKEVFLAPPQGEKRHLDLVARVGLRPNAPPPRPRATDLVVLVHVEVESRESAQAFRPRMFDYYVQLRRDSQLPVLPIGLFLRVGLDGVGAELHVEALNRIARSGENDWRRYLLAECVEAYSELDEAQRRQLQELLATEQYQEVRPLMMTTYERGKIAERLELALLQLEARFGPLAPAVRQRVESLSPEDLRRLLIEFARAQSLKELRLED